MNLINRYYFLFLILVSNTVYARSFEGTLNALKIFITGSCRVLGVIGLLLAASSFMMGKNDSALRLTQAIVGIVLLAAADPLAKQLISFG